MAHILKILLLLLLLLILLLRLLHIKLYILTGCLILVHQRFQKQLSYTILNRMIIYPMAHNIFPISKPSSHHLGLNSLVYFHCNGVNGGHSGGTAEDPFTEEKL